jgi:hypothetical protein
MMLYQFWEVPDSDLDLDIAYLTVFFAFPQALQLNAGLLPLSGQGCFLLHPFRIIIYQEA